MPQPVRLRATVEQIIDHAAGLRSLVLKPERPAPRFRPGQFLHLALDQWDPSSHWPDSRPLSVASPPDSRDRLRITVSEVGRFTTRIMSTAPGDTVWLKLPYGEFVVESRETAPAVLVAGGTGVAPFVSLVTSTSPMEGPVRLLYGVRRAELLVYRDDLDEAARRHPQFSWRAFVEDGASDGSARGRLSVEAVLAAMDTTGAPSAAVIYLSGPPAMIDTLTVGLAGAGIPPERIRVDAWA
jgi:NAD(P)H-flavin reductase